jgi:hypothetical protein
MNRELIVVVVRAKLSVALIEEPDQLIVGSHGRLYVGATKSVKAIAYCKRLHIFESRNRRDRVS